MVGITVSPWEKAYMRARAQAHMVSTVSIDRVSAPAWDSGTSLAVPGTRTNLYTGPARLWISSGISPLEIGTEAELATENINVSIPYGSAAVRRDDAISVTASFDDPYWTGKVLRIDSVDGAGLATITQRFSCSLIVASREWEM